MIRDHANAVVAALNAGNLTAYDADEIPNLAETPYAAVFVDMGLGVDGRFPDVTAKRRWRILVQFIGGTADEARWAAEQAWDVLDRQQLTVPGRVTTRCRVESTQTIMPDPDDEDIYVGSSVWTFASSPV